jgi:hypothetical protein
MKKNHIFLVIGASILWMNSAVAYFDRSSGISQQPNVNTANNKAANCAPATKSLLLEFNDVRALLENGGSMFQNRQTGTAAYEIPKVGVGETKRYAIYSASLWMGGTDVNGQLKIAALTFRQGNDFWPGPLSVTPHSGNYDPSVPMGNDIIRDYGAATIDAQECLAFDKFFTIRKAEVLAFNLWWECNNAGAVGADPHEPSDCEGVERPNNEIMNRINNWPAHGNLDKYQDPFLAPFYDRDGGGSYDPEGEGDYPWYDDIVGRDDIKCGIDRRISLFGDETHWWVFNDKGNIHGETNGDPIGMEVRAQAFAFATDDEVNRMTFYNYELINRGTQTLYNTFFSQFVDADLGNYSDDYVGCDVSRGVGYVYNGDNFDEDNSGNFGYGLNPPSLGVDFFEGPYMDPDLQDNLIFTLAESSNPVVDAIANNGIVYPGIGIGFGDGIVDNERFGMRRFTYFTSTAGFPYKDPTNAAEFYNFMQGKWQNGAEMYYGGNGTGTGGTNPNTNLSDYMFPGDSDPLGWATAGAVTNGDWSEISTDGVANGIAAADRRFVQSAGPFTLRPGAVNNITVGIVYGRSTDSDLLASVRTMMKADTKAQKLFDNCFKIMDPPQAPKLTIQELENELILMLDNPGSTNNANESYAEIDDINISGDSIDGEPIDKVYKFEGYLIYQLAEAEYSVADVNDPTKATLVAQCDIKNGVSKLVNYVFNEAYGFTEPELKVIGNDKGIQHTFRIKEDAFAQGDRTLINHKPYYFVAIAYAYNNFKTYSQTDPDALDGQKTPFISSRLGYDGGAIATVEGIPHSPMPEAGGTVQLVEYGTIPSITRLDGVGNGGMELELTQNSVNNILANGYMSELQYAQNGGPINVKVVDPLNLAKGYFECVFDDYTASSTNGSDTATWTINQYVSKTDKTLLESVSGVFNIGVSNEQIIPQWGISVQINQALYSGNSGYKFAEPLSATIEFADSSKRWLSGISDDDGYMPTNWIRSGSSTEDGAEGDPSWTAPVCYKDELNVDPDKKYTKLLNGTIAPHRLTGYQCDYMPLAYYNSGSSSPGTARTSASVSYLPSVDIVLTNDKSKWTRCPVIELCRDVNLAVGGAKQGEVRKSLNVGKDGLPDGTTNPDGTTTGMGWFPGYAIDLETGARLFMAFGENSFLGAENGSDMIWNPTDRLMDNTFSPLFGGQHAIWIFSYKQKTINNFNNGYDFPAYSESSYELFNKFKEVQGGSSSAKRELYSSLTWIANPVLAEGRSVLETDVKISLRVSKEYKNFTATGLNGGKPMYGWSTEDFGTTTNDNTALKSVLDMINVVPNPYYAYSDYERNRIDTRVKITNLPEVCTVKIYSINGKLVREFKKDSPITSLDWDLNNNKGIGIASGVYLIHVEVPGAGERIVKFFGGMRQVDLQGI